MRYAGRQNASDREAAQGAILSRINGKPPNPVPVDGINGEEKTLTLTPYLIMLTKRRTCCWAELDKNRSIVRPITVRDEVLQ